VIDPVKIGGCGSAGGMTGGCRYLYCYLAGLIWIDVALKIFISRKNAQKEDKVPLSVSAFCGSPSALSKN
jgi:hypothetical protein